MPRDLIVVTDTDTLADIDAKLARLAIWRHESPEAMARVEAVLEERWERVCG